jgi:hypothetical protein
MSDVPTNPGNASTGSSDAGAGLPGGVASPALDTGLSAANDNADACFTSDPVGGVVTTPCPLSAGGATPVILEIVDRKTGNVVTNTTQAKIVGQKIELLVRAKPPEAMSNIQWTVPGERVGNYSQSSSTATRTDLTAADLQGTNLDFYWIKGGSKAITVAATVRGSSLTAQVMQNVLAPTNVTMTSVTDHVKVGPTGWPGDPPMNLYYGKSPNVGIQWTCTATAPAGGKGEIAGTQLNNSDRKRTSNAGVVESNDSGGAYMLDTTVPYSTSVTIAAGASATWSSNDSPSTPLTASLSRKSVNDLFRMYFMYKPDGADSIWVTLMRLDWHWAGQTTRVGAPGGAGNNWTAPAGVGSDRNPSGIATSELPTWTDNVTSITWK